LILERIPRTLISISVLNCWNCPNLKEIPITSTPLGKILYPLERFLIEL